MTRTYPLCYPSSYHNVPLDIPRSPLLLRTQGVERSTGEKKLIILRSSVKICEQEVKSHLS